MQNAVQCMLDIKKLILGVVRPLKIGLCHLMTPGLSKDIQYHVWPHFFKNLLITRSDIKWADSLVIAYGYFNLGFVWVYMG